MSESTKCSNRCPLHGPQPGGAACPTCAEIERMLRAGEVPY